MHMVARRRAGYIVRKHVFYLSLRTASCVCARWAPEGLHTRLGQFGRFESRHSWESKTVRSRRGLFTGVRGIGILRTSPFGDSRKFRTAPALCGWVSYV